MNYRVSLPSDNGFENEDDEFGGMRDGVQSLMERTAPDDVCDTLLIVAKIAEFRSSILTDDYPVKHFYVRIAERLRELLAKNGSEDPAPNRKLENDLLYFPDVERTH